jgi:hypothetical protein
MALRGEMRKYGVMEIIKNTIKKEGVGGLFKGSLMSMAGIVVYKGFGFAFYEEIYKVNSKLDISNESLNFVSGAIAGVSGQIRKSCQTLNLTSSCVPI